MSGADSQEKARVLLSSQRQWPTHGAGLQGEFPEYNINEALTILPYCITEDLHVYMDISLVFHRTAKKRQELQCRETQRNTESQHLVKSCDTHALIWISVNL